MDADKLLIYLPRIYCARVLFVCIVCIRQFRYTTCILVECFDIDICILSSLVKASQFLSSKCKGAYGVCGKGVGGAG